MLSQGMPSLENLLDRKIVVLHRICLERLMNKIIDFRDFLSSNSPQRCLLFAERMQQLPRKMIQHTLNPFEFSKTRVLNIVGTQPYPVGIYLLKVNNRNTRTRF